jgi:hypothetical protein
MSTIDLIAVMAAGAGGSIIYMAPTLIGVARLSPAVGRITWINTCLGWTVVGWLVALEIACRRQTPSGPPAKEWSRWSPGCPERPISAASPSTYVDGSYLISATGEARTWAVCEQGRWGIAFELDGVQRTASWVDTSDVPIEVLALALAHDSEPKR